MRPVFCPRCHQPIRLPRGMGEITVLGAITVECPRCPGKAIIPGAEMAEA